MPANAIPRTISGLDGSSVLVDGRVRIPATAGGVAVGAVAATVGAAVGATVGARVAIGATVGATVAVAEGATVNGGRVGGMSTGWVGAVVEVGVGVAVAAQVVLVMVFVSSVTAPFRASARPSIVAPVVRVIDSRARIVPLKADPVPIVAELPICQKMLQDCAPPMRTTLLPDAVVSVEPAWKIQTSSDPPESVSIPVSPNEDAEL